MKAILATAASILLVVALAVAVLLLLSGSPREGTSHELADTVHTIGGKPTTCTELFGETCSFALQSDYNQWGQNLEGFVNAGILGPFARSIGFVAEAKLSLQACEVSATAGRDDSRFLHSRRDRSPHGHHHRPLPLLERVPPIPVPGKQFLRMLSAI